MIKFLTSVFLIIFCTNIFYVGVSASEDRKERSLNIKQLIISKNYLKKSYKGRKYTKTIDAFVLKNKDNKKALEKISNKVSPIVDSSQIKNQETLNIIKYMDAKTTLALLEIYKEEDLNFYKEEISTEDKKYIEDKIVELQLNIFNKGEKSLKIFMKEFESLAKYEDNGDFNMNLNLDHDSIGKIESSFNFNNYTFVKNNFDSQLKGEVEALINASIKGEEEFKIQLSGFIDFISKDGNVYILLEKLNITDEKGIEKIKDLLDKAKLIAEQNKYISYSNNETKEALKILNSLTPNKIINDGKNILSKPMFEAYKKDDDKYLLKPTKYACSTIKDLANKFDPFNGIDCSDSQYNKMLNELSKFGELYIKVGEQNEIGINLKDNNSELQGTIVYNEENILQLNLDIFDNSDSDESFKLEYEKFNKLYSKLDTNDGNIHYLFDSKLNKNNKFTEIDFKGNILDNGDDYSMNFILKNKKVNGDINIDISSYDWNTDSYKKSQNIVVDIKGTTSYNNSLSTINIDTKGTNIKDDTQFLLSEFKYKSGDITLNNYINSSYLNTTLELNGKRNNSTNVLTEGKLNMSAEVMDYYSESGYKEIFNTNISLENNNISGTTYISDGEKTLANITHSGKYEKDYLEFNNLIELENNPLDIFGGNSKDARNSKRYSDLGNLQSAISLKLFEGVKLTDMINGEVINYQVLNIDKNHFLDPLDNSDYGIKINGDKYQLLAKIEDEYGNKTAYLRGNTQESLFTINGKIINNYDILEEGTIEEETEPKVTLNINTKTDLRNNFQNILFYIDFNLNTDKILEFKVENKSKRSYVEKEIIAPTNTIDYKEVFGFKSQNSYGINARNSKRVSDLGNIQSAISLRLVEGAHLKTFVIQNEKYEGKDLYVGGNKLITGENYFIGTLNYSVLNISEKDFKDPNGNEYIIATTTENGGRFQLFSVLEDNSNNIALVNGTYYNKATGQIKFTKIGNNMIVIESKSANSFSAGNNTNLGKISKVSRDGLAITFEKPILKVTDVIYLEKNNSIGLININGKIIQNMDILY